MPWIADVLAIQDTVTRAAAAGVVSAAEGAAWLDGLGAASEAGRFFAALSGFMVVGRKP